MTEKRGELETLEQRLMTEDEIQKLRRQI